MFPTMLFILPSAQAPRPQKPHFSTKGKRWAYTGMGHEGCPRGDPGEW